MLFSFLFNRTVPKPGVLYCRDSLGVYRCRTCDCSIHARTVRSRLASEKQSIPRIARHAGPQNYLIDGQSQRVI